MMRAWMSYYSAGSTARLLLRRQCSNGMSDRILGILQRGFNIPVTKYQSREVPSGITDSHAAKKYDRAFTARTQQLTAEAVAKFARRSGS